FLGQALAGLDAQKWHTCRESLTLLAVAYRPGASELAFGYGLAAARAGHPSHRLAGSRLPGADLPGWRVGRPASRGADHAEHPARLDLSAVVLAGANLTGSRLDGVDLCWADLSGADLTCAMLTASDVRHANLTQAVLVGTILRDCHLDGLW